MGENNQMIRRICFTFAILFHVSALQASILIDVGNFPLLPNTAGQEIVIEVSGGDLVQGLNFNAQIGDGGVDLGGVTVGPSIEDIDILAGTIFDGNNTGAVDPELLGGVDFPLVEFRTTTTNNGTVAAAGLLATLTIDTTGFFSGEFPLILSATLNGPTDFAGVSATITDGTITIVPEPSSFIMALVGAIAGLGCATLRRRS